MAKCLAWLPVDRVVAKMALQSDFVVPSQLRLPLGAPPGVRVFAGSRHPWNMLVGSMDVPVLQWLRADFVGPDAVQLDLDFSATRPDVKTEEGRKFIMAGRMTHDTASGGCCALSLAKLLPVPRLRAWFAAFKQANKVLLQPLSERLRAVVSALEPEGEDLNRIHFLQQPFGSWFCNAGELCISRAGGSWEEDLHQDGGASVVQIGITVYGRRRLTRRIPEGSPAEVLDYPGTVYIGGGSGPQHEGKHLPRQGD